jgi:mRNA interferase RelE/StbE
MFKVVLHRRSARYLKRLPPADQTRLKEALGQLRDQPTRVPGSKPMYGRWKGYWRIRVGELRVLFWVDEAQQRVYIDHIGPRGDIYK